MAMAPLLVLTTAIATLTVVRSLRTPSPLAARRFASKSLRPSPMSMASDTAAPPLGVDPPDRTVTILQRGPRHVVAYKPPAVLSHHSGWAGSRSRKRAKKGEEPEVPMLQRVRDALHDIDGRGAGEGGGDGESSGDGDDAPKRRVNLVHRLDRGASGCLLLTYADDEDGGPSSNTAMGDTARLIDAMSSDDSTKTYVALVRGEGVLCGENLVEKGWFEVSRPIKDDSGETKDATTLFNFVAGQAETSSDRPRVSLVLARPKEGRFHQIRKHLAGLSHPILGDSSHGHSKTNREWKETRNLPGERIALHLARLQLGPTLGFPGGIDAAAPVADDMLEVLRAYAPDVLEASLTTLEEEGVLIEADGEYEVGRYEPPELVPRDELPPFEYEPSTVLCRSDHYVVVDKPPVVLCHNSKWSGDNRSDSAKRKHDSRPMLQRARDTTGRTVNLVHRLDRGASGCLLLSFAENAKSPDGCSVTRTLIESMQSPDATKTYVALVDGDGSWNGADYLSKGWFTFSNPVKDEWGKAREDATTDFLFAASTVLPPADDEDPDNFEGRKVSIVLARPRTGRWHQIRQHLASGTIGHAILGDSSHGRSRTNRSWKKRRGMMKERTCLHLSRLQCPETEFSKGGIDVSSPMPDDMRRMLGGMGGLLNEARPALEREGVVI